MLSKAKHLNRLLAKVINLAESFAPLREIKKH
jgi:hypothetical protein